MKHNAPTKREVPAYAVMTQPIETVRTSDSIHDVASLFTENHIGAAVVLNPEGNPIGVITKTDIVRYEKERSGDATVRKGQTVPSEEGSNPAGFHWFDDDDIVENWMNPVIFNVKRDTPISEIARKMVRYRIHHIFVKAPKEDLIIGVISSFDVLKYVAV